jgi:hypothetical protein
LIHEFEIVENEKTVDICLLQRLGNQTRDIKFVKTEQIDSFNWFGSTIESEDEKEVP